MQEKDIKVECECKLIPTHLDHLKLLKCQIDEESRSLMSQQQIELEQSNHIRMYIKDIFVKLQEKQRKFKLTCKKKYIMDALFSSNNIRVASVYIVVVCANNQTLIVPKGPSVHLTNKNGSDEEGEGVDPARKKRHNTNSSLVRKDEHGVGVAEMSEQLRKNRRARLVNVKHNIIAQNQNAKGYESEGEKNSMNSTTTSSTIPLINSK